MKKAICALLAFAFFAGCLSANIYNEQSFDNDLVADFTFTPDDPSMVSIIQFKSLTDDKLTYRWDFGDGETSRGTSSTHRYLKAGMFNVTLSVYDYESGKNASCTKTINVIEKENGSLPNKWAILGVMWGQGDVDYVYKDYNIVMDCLKELAFPESHIFRLENTKYTNDIVGETFKLIKKASSDWVNATIILWSGSHGVATPGTRFDATGNTIFHSGLVKVPTNNPIPDPENIFMWDHELKKILDEHTHPSQKLLVVITACESGYFAAQDTSGTLHGKTDDLYTSAGGKGRIIITDTTAPLAAFFGVQAQYFWKDGLVNGKGDTNPINGNNDGITSVEEAWFYYKSCSDFRIASAQPCMNDQYPAENPEEGMFL